jgi:long-subunit fatty acid transport protein
MRIQFKKIYIAMALGGLLLSSAASEAVVNIQNVGAGARSSALGNSFVAIADDADAVFANPAGLSQIGNKQLSYTNVSLFFGGIEGDDLGQHVVSYVQPLGSKLGLGLGYERIGSELMSENGAFLSLSYKVSKTLNLGLTTKYLFWSVGDIPADNGRADPLSNQSAGNVGVDLGAMWKSPFKGAQLGLLLKNLNQPNVAKGSVPGDSDAGKLPMDVHLGVAYQVNPSSLVSVQYVLRDVSGDESDSRLVLGGETKLVEGLMLRAGGSKIFEDEATGDLNAGLGYQWNKLQFDYGYHIPLDLTETNGAHRFSFAYGF